MPCSAKHLGRKVRHRASERGRSVGGTEHARRAKVDESGQPVGADHEVLGLYVAVHNSDAVKVGKRCGCAGDEARDSGRVQPGWVRASYVSHADA